MRAECHLSLHAEPTQKCPPHRGLASARRAPERLPRSSRVSFSGRWREEVTQKYRLLVQVTGNQNPRDAHLADERRREGSNHCKPVAVTDYLSAVYLTVTEIFAPSALRDV